jgi:hypothetical protein
VSDGLEVQAANVVYAAVGWLRSTYQEHQIVVERDLVWTLQRRIAREISLQGLSNEVHSQRGASSAERGTGYRWSIPFANLLALAALPSLIEADDAALVSMEP